MSRPPSSTTRTRTQSWSGSEMEGNVEELRELAEEEEGPEMCETPPAPPLLPLSPEDWRPLLLQYHRDGGALPTLLEEADLAATQLTQAVDAACARCTRSHLCPPDLPRPDDEG